MLPISTNVRHRTHRRSRTPVYWHREVPDVRSRISIEHPLAAPASPFARIGTVVLTLFFEGMSSTWSFRTAPVEFFRIDATTITDANGETIAVRKGGYWNARGNSYTHIDCEGPVTVRFASTDGLALTGTFNKVSVLSSTLYGDDSYLAMLTNAGEWRDYRTLKTAHSLTLESA